MIAKLAGSLGDMLAIVVFGCMAALIVFGTVALVAWML